MSNGTNSTILNPDIYLNHFPPDEARQFEISRNLYIAILGLVAGDILSFIPEDIRIIKRCNGLITTTCFALVRFFVLVYMGLSVALFTIPVPNCRGVIIATGCFCLITMGTTSFLFMRRVQVVYTGNRLVYWVFTILWAVTSGIVVLLLFGTETRPLPGTKYCTVYKAQSYVPISNFMPAVFDTLVFLAISYKIAFQHNWAPGRECSWTRSWFSTSTLPVLSKAILQGGQQYYLITFCLNIFAGAFSFSPLVPPMHRVLISIPATSLSACLACRAHRIMVEAYYCNDEEAGPPALSAIQFASTRPHFVVSQHVARVENAPVEPKRLSIESGRS